MPSTASSSTTFFAELRRIGRYFVVGGVAACMDIGLFMLFAQRGEVPAALGDYFARRRYVFADAKGKRAGDPPAL